MSVEFKDYYQVLGVDRNAAAVHLAGVSRRSFLVYCRAGLVRPVFQPPYGVMEFTEEAIYTVRRMGL